MLFDDSELSDIQVDINNDTVQIEYR